MKHPISVDDEFFERLNPIIEELREVAIRAIAEHNNLSTDQVRAVARGERKKIADDIEQKKGDFILGRVISDLEIENRVSYSVSYDNGYSFTTDSVDQLRQTLMREPGRPLSLRISNSGYRAPAIYLRLYDGRTTAEFYVSGVRRDVEHLSRRITDLLRASEPEHRWLHTDWVGRLITISGMISFFAAWVLLGISYSDSLGKEAGQLIAFFSGPMAGVGAWAAQPIVRAAEAAYPKCQFEYGPERRRRSSQRTLLAGTLTLLILPTLLALLVG